VRSSIGRTDPESGSFRLHIDLFRAGRGTPVFTRSAAFRSDQACLGVLHQIGIDLRRAAGEAPCAIALTDTPTTQSLAAFQAFASAAIEAESGRPDTALGLHRGWLPGHPRGGHRPSTAGSTQVILAVRNSAVTGTFHLFFDRQHLDARQRGQVRRFVRRFAVQPIHSAPPASSNPPTP
jgi:hypothetical protein